MGIGRRGGLICLIGGPAVRGLDGEPTGDTVAAMKMLLFVGFIFAGFAAAFTEAMIFASRGNAGVFWIAVTILMFAMVIIGGWELSDKRTNRLGWAFMVLAAAFSLFSAFTTVGGPSLLKVVFFVTYGAIGVLAFLKEGKGDSAPAH